MGPDFVKRMILISQNSGDISSLNLHQRGPQQLRHKIVFACFDP